MPAIHEAIEMFITPWDTASNSLLREELNGPKASIFLHISDLVMVLYLIINAL